MPFGQLADGHAGQETIGSYRSDKQRVPSCRHSLDYSFNPPGLAGDFLVERFKHFRI